MTIYLIRHERTQGNLERRYIGATDQSLCPVGRAALAGRTMPPVDAVYASPLLRCRETAALLFPQNEARIVENFRECSFGAFENRTYEELKDDPAYRAWLDCGDETPPPGGESRPQQRERSVRAFREIVSQHGAGETLALVVHGGTIMCLLEALEASHRFYDWQVPNGGGFVCTWDNKELCVEGRR